jgi:pantothenate synthetase
MWWTKKQDNLMQKHDPLNQREQAKASATAEVLEVWEKTVKGNLLDIQKDIEGINMVLQDQHRRMDALEIVLQDLSERNSDAIELKKTLMSVLEKLDYVKVNR